MIFSVINFLRGFLRISAKGEFTERFLNLAIKNNIYLWDIKKVSDGCIEMCVSVRGFKRIRNAARRTKTKVKIKKRYGLPMFLHKHRKRKAFYIGFTVFVAILLFLSSFIWSVEITGADKTDKKIILEEIKKQGIYPGTLRYGHNKREIKEKTLAKIPTLSWMWVDIKGTRAIISVKEITEKPEIYNKNTPCNIVAKKAGVIENIIVRNGESTVNVGDVVKKGDLLVSGVSDINYEGIRLINARGEIYAFTWYEKSGTFPLEVLENKKTGRKKTKFSVLFGEKEIPVLPFGGFEKYNEETKQVQLKLWGDVYLPISIKNGSIYEVREYSRKMDENEAVIFYADRMAEEMKKEMEEGAVVCKKEVNHTVKDGKITISVMLECRENIAKRVEIEVGG